MYPDILSRVRTKEEVEKLKEEIDLLLEGLYKKDGSAFAKENLDREKFLRGLKTEIEKLKKVTLTLAFEPTEATIEKIHKWARDAYGNGIILEIVLDQSILGGAIIVFEGKYGDYSLRKILEKEFEGSREEIWKILNTT